MLHCGNDCSENPFCRRSRKKIVTKSVLAAHTVALIFFQKIRYSITSVALIFFKKYATVLNQ